MGKTATELRNHQLNSPLIRFNNLPMI